MKKNLLLLTFLLTFTITAFSQTVTPEVEGKQFANKVLYTIKKSDMVGFNKFAITVPDWQKLLATLTKVPKDEKQKMLDDGRAEMVTYSSSKSYDKITKTAKREFINWDQIKIESTNAVVDKRGNLKYLSFTIFFQFEGKSFKFFATDCLKTPNGWKMTKGADLVLVN